MQDHVFTEIMSVMPRLIREQLTGLYRQLMQTDDERKADVTFKRFMDASTFH